MSDFFLKIKYLLYTFKTIVKEARYAERIEFEDIEKVEKELLLKLEKNMNDYSTLRLLKNIYMKKNNLEKFIEIYNKLLEHKFTFNNIKKKNLKDYVKLLYDNKKYEKIIKILDKIDITDQELLSFLLFSFSHSEREDRFKHIIEIGKRKEKLSNNHYKLFEILGYAYQKTNDFKNAKKYYLKALDINPESGVKKNLAKINRLMENTDD